MPLTLFILLIYHAEAAKQSSQASYARFIQQAP